MAVKEIGQVTRPASHFENGGDINRLRKFKMTKFQNGHFDNAK